METLSPYVCRSCGHQLQTWPLRCPQCHSSDSIEARPEQGQREAQAARRHTQSYLLRLALGSFATALFFLLHAVYALAQETRVSLLFKRSKYLFSATQLLILTALFAAIGVALICLRIYKAQD
ncbi:MAG: hypothetical protein JO360_11720 [Acidobacteria bacterium]|nr:hypothetical protein [Acidobacteriota bacterium]